MAIAAKSATLPKMPKELFDQWVQGPMTAEAIQDAPKAFKKALTERALTGESAIILAVHLAATSLPRLAPTATAAQARRP